MRRSARIVPAAALLLMALSAVGCCDKEKKEIAALQDKCNELSLQNKELRDQVASAESAEAGFKAQLDAKDLELADARARMAALEAKASAPAGTGKTAPGWTPTPFGDKVTVGTDVLFASGRATLTSAGKTALSQIVSTLKSTYAGLPVRVYGYTDSDPIQKTRKLWQDNLDLSANRAMAVTRYLVSKGVDASSIETTAMGATHFVASNATRSGKAKNRRVEIFVVKK